MDMVLDVVLDVVTYMMICDQTLILTQGDQTNPRWILMLIYLGFHDVVRGVSNIG